MVARPCKYTKNVKFYTFNGQIVGYVNSTSTTKLKKTQTTKQQPKQKFFYAESSNVY